jgi:hypothetical protein
VDGMKKRSKAMFSAVASIRCRFCPQSAVGKIHFFVDKRKKELSLSGWRAGIIILPIRSYATTESETA